MWGVLRFEPLCHKAQPLGEGPAILAASEARVTHFTEEETGAKRDEMAA